MMQEVFSELTAGFIETIKIFILTLVGAVPLGLLVAFGSMSKYRPVSMITGFFVWVMRGTPLMLQLIVVYYGPGLVLHTNFWGMGTNGRFIAVIAAFIINYAAYFSEIYRGGIQSIPKGQYEAGQVLGLTKTQIFRNIILLQVIKRIIPPMSNEIITLVKDTSLARVIAVYEITWMGQAFIKSDGIIWPLFMTGMYYLAFTGILTVLLKKMERKFEYFK